MSTGLPLSDRRAFWRAAQGFADLSRRAILSRIARQNARLKPDATVVTDADFAAERVLRAAIARRFPDHGIVGEELPPTREGSPFRWIIDPIDGTLSFSRGLPFYGTILALHYLEEPIVGLIDHPSLGTRVSAALGLGAWKEGRRLKVREFDGGRGLAREIVATGDRGHFVRCGAGAAFDRLMRSGPQVRAYADCLGHGLVAQGALAAMADYGIRLWDWAATPVLLREAGGVFELAHRCRRGGVEKYGVLFGAPAAVRWLGTIFGARGGVKPSRGSA